jgi:uncharacterized protein with PIN domain
MVPVTATDTSHKAKLILIIMYIEMPTKLITTWVKMGYVKVKCQHREDVCECGNRKFKVPDNNVTTIFGSVPRGYSECTKCGKMYYKNDNGIEST